MSRFIHKSRAGLLLIIPSVLVLSACESSGNYRIGSVGSAGAQGATGAQGERGETGATGATGPAGPAGANGTNGANGLALGNASALAVGGLVGPGGVAGTGLLASTGSLNNTNPIVSGVLVKSGGLVNVVADKGLLFANAIDSKIPGSSNLVGTVIGVVKSTGVALVQTGNGQQYLVDGLAAAPGQLITATIGKATAIGSPTASPLIGASLLSPGQTTGSLLTVGVGSNGQLLTLQRGANGTGLPGAGGLGNGNIVGTVTGALPGAGGLPGVGGLVTGNVVGNLVSTVTGTVAPPTGGTGGLVTGVTGTVGGLLGKPKKNGN